MLAGSLASSGAEAASITLRLYPALDWRDGTLSLAMDVENEGDTTARSIEPSLWFGGRSVHGSVHPALAPGDTHPVKLTLATPPPSQGRWPYRIAVDYTDATQHPFQALTVGTLVVGDPAPVDVTLGDVPTLRLARRGALTLRIANAADEPRRLALDAHLPLGIELADAIPPVELAAGEERTLEVPLRNQSALPGSRYAVFVSAEYHVGAVHQALVIPASIEIVASEPLLEAWAPWLYGGAALLAAGWLAAVAWQWLASPR